MDEFNCVCGTSTWTKKDGSPWKHQTPDGEKCTQNKRVVSQTATPSEDSHDAGGLLEAGSVTQNNSGEAELVYTADETTGSREEADADPVYTLEVNVYRSISLPLMKDAGWQNENKRLAERNARKAGKTPTGEARLVREEERGQKTVLVYEVPVRRD